MKGKASIYIIVMILSIPCFISLALVSSPKIMGANTVYVDGSNTGFQDGTLEHPYNTIQKGVNAASVGEAVQVVSGTYYENVAINKSMTLRGAGSYTTIIDGGGPPKTVVEITADNVNISGFTIRNGGNGIHLYICNGITMSKNAITLNNYDGIWLEASSSNTISGNTITSNDFSGIATEDSNDNLINGNTITNNKYWGVDLLRSYNNTIFGNTITSHTQWSGILLDNSQKVTVSGNILSNNGGGVELWASSGGIIRGNTLSNNDVGVELSDSGGNTFYHNNFISNTDQVISYNSASMWNNSYPSGGNYWSHYEGNDTYSGPFQNITGSDGIGDVPYNSTEYEKDHYPLMAPYDETNPMADAGPDQLVVNGTSVTFNGSGSTDNLDIVNYGIVNYTWSFTDVNPQTLTGVQANYTFNNVGNFSVTLNVSDYSGNWDTDEMWVNVTATETIRDIAIANITVFPTIVTTGDTILINVTVVNKGDFSENSRVIVYYDSSVVGEKNVTSLASGTNETLGFNWNTMGVPGRDYTIKATATIVAGETNTTDNTYVDGTVIILTHDVAVTNVTTSSTLVYQGDPLNIYVEVKNKGNFTETFDVTVYYGNTTVGTQTGIVLAAQNETTLPFIWDTTPVALGSYAITAEAILAGDDNPTDNTFTDGTVKIVQFPTASFTYSPENPVTDQVVTFDASLSTSNGGTIVSYVWDFGDGNTTTTADPIITHVYATSGTYNVTLTITDSEELTDTTAQIVTVEEAPPPGVPLYLFVAAAVAGAFIIAAVAFYFLKIKSPKPT